MPRSLADFDHRISKTRCSFGCRHQFAGLFDPPRSVSSTSEFQKPTLDLPGIAKIDRFCSFSSKRPRSCRSLRRGISNSEAITVARNDGVSVVSNVHTATSFSVDRSAQTATRPQIARPVNAAHRARNTNSTDRQALRLAVPSSNATSKNR